MGTLDGGSQLGLSFKSWQNACDWVELYRVHAQLQQRFEVLYKELDIARKELDEICDLMDDLEKEQTQIILQEDEIEARYAAMELYDEPPIRRSKMAKQVYYRRRSVIKTIGKDVECGNEKKYIAASIRRRLSRQRRAFKGCYGLLYRVYSASIKMHGERS